MIATILLGLAAAMAGVLALVLLVPFHVAARGSIHGEAVSGAIEVAWGPGLAGLRLSDAAGLRARLLGLPLPRIRRGPRRPGRARRRAREPGRRDGGREAPGAEALLRHRRALLGMAARLARPLRLRLRLAGTVGTGDPADVALLAAMTRAAGGLPGVDLDVGWDWVEEALELDGALTARVWLVHLLGAAAALWLRRENRAALRALRGRRIPA